MSVQFAVSDHLDMAEHSYMWILVVRFDLTDALDDAGVIAAVINSPQYGYDFASPFDGDASPSHPEIHGRWWRTYVTADHFHPCAPAHAVEVVRHWAEEQDWTDSEFTQPPDVQERLEDAYSLLRSGQVYELSNPPAEHEHDYRWVMGRNGFHEFVVVRRTDQTAFLIAACDD